MSKRGKLHAGIYPIYRWLLRGRPCSLRSKPYRRRCDPGSNCSRGDQPRRQDRSGGWANRHKRAVANLCSRLSKQTGINRDRPPYGYQGNRAHSLGEAVQSGTSPYDVIDFEDELTIVLTGRLYGCVERPAARRLLG
jgi:hypothetical protein